MRTTFFIILFIFSFCNLHANSVDSLLSQLTKLEGKAKVEVLASLCWELKFTDHKKALGFGEEGLELARTISDEEFEAQLLKSIGTVYFIKSDFDQALKYLEQSVSLFQKQKDAVGVAKVKNMLGLLNTNRGAYVEAVELFEQSILLFRAIGDTSKVVDIEANIGNVYFRKGEYQKALPSYMRIVEKARQEQDQEKLATNIYNLGITYTKLGDYPKALDYLFEASVINKSRGSYFHWIKSQNEIALVFRRLDFIDEAIELYQPILAKAIELDNKNLIASINNNLGLCYSKKGQIDKALGCYNKSLEIRQSLGVLDVGHVLNNIAGIYQVKGNDERALQFYRRALEINTQLKIKSKITLDQIGLGVLYLKQNKYATAEPYLLKALSTLEETKDLKQLVRVNELLSSLYQKQDQKQEESKYQNLFEIYSDSLYNKEKLLAATQIIIREQLKEKTQRIDEFDAAQLDSERTIKSVKQINQRLFVFVIVFILFIAIGLFFFYKRWDSKRQKLSENLELTQTEKYELQNNLKKQNREMVLFSLDLFQKEELLKSLKKQLSVISKSQPKNAEIRSLFNKLNINEIITKDWSYFNEVFNKAFPDFTLNIRKKHPNLSRKELQHCVLIKLNTPPASAANILGISTESVHTARYRLRKKLSLVRQESLEDAIHNI